MTTKLKDLLNPEQLKELADRADYEIQEGWVLDTYIDGEQTTLFELLLWCSEDIDHEITDHFTDVLLQTVSQINICYDVVVHPCYGNSVEIDFNDVWLEKQGKRLGLELELLEVIILEVIS